MVGALIVRLPGLTWGLPYVYHPDEPTHVGIVLNILKTGDLNPHWFKYPSFRVYISLPVAIIYFLLGVARGQFSSVQELEAATMLGCGSGTTAVPGLYAGLRLLMTLFGVLGVGLLFWWGEKHWDRRVGLLAALVLLFSPLDVLVGHWYRPDTILSLFSGAAVLAAALLLKHEHPRYYLLAGALAGLAASVKYNAVALQFFPIILAHLLARRRLLDWRLWLTPLAAAAVFLAITPYALLDLPGFLDGFAFEIGHYYVRGHVGADAAGFGANLLWYLGKMGYYQGLLLVLAAISPLLMPKGRRLEVALLLSWPLLVLLLNASAKARTVLALVPATLILALLAALALDRMLVLIGYHLRRGAGRTSLTLVLLMVTLVVPLARVVQVDAAFAQPDVRLLTQRWLEANVSHESHIMSEAYGPVLQWPNARYSFYLIEHTSEWYQMAGFDYLVASHYWTFYVSPALHPSEVAAYDRLLQFPEMAVITGPLQYHYDPMHDLHVLRVPLPDRYELLTGDADAPWLTEGYYGPEWHEGTPYRWTAGKAVLYVPLKGGQSYTLTLRGNDGRPPEALPAHSSLYLNEQPLGEHTWAREVDTWRLTFVAPRADATKQMVALRLDTNTWRPSDYQSSDERELGVRLEGISVQEVPPQAP
jgi:4-amino-4-deoxy-L-arabinose transferase-like glycosyltransferase